MGLRFDKERDAPGAALSTEQMSLSLSEDKDIATIGLLQEGVPTAQVALDSTQLDSIIAKLGEARAVMRQEVTKAAPQETGMRELAIINPMWRTNPPLHPGLDGIVLRFRHSGFGWLTFILPHHEALSLGSWLVDYYEKSRASSLMANGESTSEPSRGGE
jgi:hypothetical protein